MRSAPLTTLLLLLLLPCLTSARAIRQDEGKLLLPPNFIQAGDANSQTIIVGFSLASLPSIPLSATIESEIQTLDTHGNSTITRHATRVFRDVCGSLRTEIDSNAIGTPSDARLINVQIYDAISQSSMSLTPWNKSAFLIEQEVIPFALMPPGSTCLLRSSGPARPDAKHHPARSLSPQPSKHPLFVEPHTLGFAGQLQPQPDIRREELGVEVLEGLPLRHGRETSHFPAGFAGQKNAYTVVTNYWYSQELQAFVLIKQLGPDDTVQTLTLRNISRENPDSSLFTIPKGYTVHKVLMKAPETQYIL